MLEYSCYSNTWEAEAGESGVQGHPLLCSEFEASLGLHELSEPCGVQTTNPVMATQTHKGCDMEGEGLRVHREVPHLARE